MNNDEHKTGDLTTIIMHVIIWALLFAGFFGSLGLLLKAFLFLFNTVKGV